MACFLQVEAAKMLCFCQDLCWAVVLWQNVHIVVGFVGFFFLVQISIQKWYVSEGDFKMLKKYIGLQVPHLTLTSKYKFSHRALLKYGECKHLIIQNHSVGALLLRKKKSEIQSCISVFVKSQDCWSTLVKTYWFQLKLVKLPNHLQNSRVLIFT